MRRVRAMTRRLLLTRISINSQWQMRRVRTKMIGDKITNTLCQKMICLKQGGQCGIPKSQGISISIYVSTSIHDHIWSELLTMQLYTKIIKWFVNVQMLILLMQWKFLYFATNMNWIRILNKESLLRVCLTHEQT